MHFLFVKLIDLNYKEDVILALQSVGVTKASYIESENLERALSDEIRLFTGFLSRGANEGHQAIFTALVDTPDQIREFVDNLKDAGIAIDKEEIIRVLAWPIELAYDLDFGWYEAPQKDSP